MKFLLAPIFGYYPLAEWLCAESGTPILAIYGNARSLRPRIAAPLGKLQRLVLFISCVPGLVGRMEAIAFGCPLSLRTSSVRYCTRYRLLMPWCPIMTEASVTPPVRCVRWTCSRRSCWA